MPKGQKIGKDGFEVIAIAIKVTYKSEQSVYVIAYVLADT